MTFFDGTKWSRVTSSAGQRLWVTADNDVWVFDSSTAYHYTTTWSSVSFGSLSALWSSSPTSAWTFTSSEVYRYLGGAWNSTW